MRRPIATRPSLLKLLLVACGLCAALAACGTSPNVGGAGSERWQSQTIRVGLPF